ncbi:hypothetical protein B0T19DRAFT_142291 [Cercophora scortea]|uniref:Secreted protein n=1 Tax=Cercophora scortea TaxID=314031 RepID=A0AAE0IZP0_9PEZI|nr:hypothetical protein B0T19DRAFT_142291 [Cercophora scortea]
MRLYRPTATAALLLLLLHHRSSPLDHAKFSLTHSDQRRRRRLGSFRSRPFSFAAHDLSRLLGLWSLGTDASKPHRCAQIEPCSRASNMCVCLALFPLFRRHMSPQARNPLAGDEDRACHYHHHQEEAAASFCFSKKRIVRGTPIVDIA